MSKLPRDPWRVVGRGLLLAALLGGACSAGGAEPAGLAFRVAKLVAMDDADTVINDAVLLVQDGRIAALGPAREVAIPADYRVFEFVEHWLVPGIVEAHNHSAAGGWNDLNDLVYLTNPGLDSRCVPQPDNDWVKMDREGGVTTVLMLPGSGTNLTGMGTIVNTGGHTPDEIVMRTPGSLKVAQSGNPEWYFGGNEEAYMNWNLRLTLQKARTYCEKWTAYERGETQRPPEFDPIWEPFRGVFRREIPVLVHTQTYQVVLATMAMIVEEFKVWTILGHSCFDAWKLGEIVAAADVWTINGPRQYFFDTTACRMIGFTGGWAKNGVQRLGITTDSPVIPQRELTYQAAMACWYGWLPYPALRGVTNITAKSIGMYDRIGSLEVGKQADLSVWTGDPIDPRSACLLTVVNGEIVYDGTRGLRRF